MGRIAALLADVAAVARLVLELLDAARAARGRPTDDGARSLPNPAPEAGAPLAGVVRAERPAVAEPPDPRGP